jgi:phosphatidylserine/phosphatidylglycerophosphate/cardiolipin synthase-like enzyme/uncharacterized membrane protein YdjX (TVP38/TMEM64 family)
MSQPPPIPNGQTLLQAGRNAWRVERAPRAAVLVDGAAYFGALRLAMRKARRSIHIAGWDINSRMRLVGPGGEADDGLPALLGDFLTALVRGNPQLSIKLLLWDFSVVYSLEREKLPFFSLQWKTPPQIELCLDDDLPIGASHHQKIVVVDDSIAFCGGLDLTVRRWDEPAHAPGDPRRVDPAGTPYGPFHDAQLLVDGAAARALAELFRRRWARAACETLVETQAADDPWPESVRPDFRHVRIGISRTEPHYRQRPEIREIETLLLDLIGGARRWIYIEEQYLTNIRIARHLTAALAANPALEALVVVPRRHHSPIGARTMRTARLRCIECLRAARDGGRLRLVHPQVDGGDVMVHAKVTIVDDRLLRIGSANLSHRSMGVDSECDLTIEAATAAERAAVAAVRDRLVAEHCGASPGAVRACMERTGSLLAALDVLGDRHRRLVDLAEEASGPDEARIGIEALADPERPLGLASFLGADAAAAPGRGRARQPLRHAATIGVVVAAAILLLLAWRFTQLAELTDPGVLGEVLATAADSFWAPVIVVAVFVLAGLVAFPVTALIAGTALTFGAWPGIAYAGAGALANAVVIYAIGFWLGSRSLRKLMGPRLNRLRRQLARRGIVAVTIVRLVPLAPFTVVNLVAGAFRIPLPDYVVGTALGLAPGLIVMSLLGEQILHILSEPTLPELLVLGGLLAAWIALCVGLQALVSRARER